MKKSIFCMSFMAFFAAQGAGTLTFAPGDGQTTNVTEMLGGTFDALQINTGTSGGGIVNMLNPLSYFLGAPTVDCGTLAVKDLRPIGQPSALGRGAPGDAITVKDGTFRYEGAPGETDRGLVLSPTGAKKASVLSVADGTSLKLTGDIEVERGVMVKRGGGTLIFAPATVGASNQLSRYDFIAEGYPTFNANGDSPAIGFGNFTIYDGKVVIDAPNTSTNYFRLANAGYAYVGMRSTETGPETEAHMEIRGGVNYMPYNVFVGYRAGDTTTAAQTLHHSLDVYDGVFDNSAGGMALWLGSSSGMANNNFVSHLNIHGGKVRTFYFRPGQSLGNVSRTVIDGGTLECYGVYGGQYTDVQSWDSPNVAYIPDIDIHVCSNGMMRLTSSTFYLCRDGLVKQTVRITDGGTLRFLGFCAENSAAVKGLGRLTFLVDGGKLITSDGNGQFLPGVTTKIGAKGLFWNSTYTYTVNGPVVSADGVANDGGMELSGSGTFKFFGPTSFNGPVVVKGDCALTVSNLFSASSVTMTDGAISMARTGATIKHLKHASGSGRFDFGTLSAAATPKLTLLAWDVPGFVRIKFASNPAAGTYELIDFPTSTGLTADRVVIDGSYAAGTDCAFSVTTSGATSTLVLTVTSNGSATGTAYSWDAAAGGDWATGGNWSGGSAPGSDTLADLTFSAVPASEPITLTLDASAKASSLAFPAAGGYRIAGSGSLALGKNNAKVTITGAGASTNKIEVPVTVSGPIEFDIPKKGRLEFSSVSGAADLTMNCSTRHGGDGFGGTVRIDSLAGFKGAIDFLSGLISVGSIPSGIRSMRVGYGEFRYTGAGDATLDCPVTFASDMYAEARIGVSDPNATLTINGMITQENGGFWKVGQGALTLAGARAYSFGRNTASYNVPPATNPMGWDDVKHEWIWDANGRVPTYNSCMVAGGKLAWGGTAGQTVAIGSNYGLVVGGISTSLPGGEYDAELDILGGATTVGGSIYVSYNHGNSRYSTASKPRLTAKLAVSGGSVSARNLMLALEDKGVSTGDAVYEQTGGDVTISQNTLLGYNGADCTAAFTLAGGTFKTSLMRVGEVQPAPRTTVTLSGGTLNAPTICLRSGTNTMSVLEGAAVRTAMLYTEKSYTSQKNTLHFDGGTLIANLTSSGSAGIIQDINTFTLGERGMRVDISEITNSYFSVMTNVVTAPGVATDGGITVYGDTYSIGALAFGNMVQEFNGGITVESGGNVRAYLEGLTNIAVAVKDGGAFGAQWTSYTTRPACVASLQMGEAAGDRTIIQIHTALPDYGSNVFGGKIFARDSFAANGTVEVVFVNNRFDSFVVPSGTQTILIAPRGSIDAGKFVVSARMPGVSGAFAVSSYNADYDQLTVTLSSSVQTDHTWTAAGGGSWLDGGNWSALPADSPNDAIIFPASLAADAAVAMGGDRVVGSIAQNSEAKVALAGGVLEMGGTAPAITTVSNGVLELPAVEASAAVNVNEAANSGKVVLAAPQGDASFALKGGTLEGDVENLGTGEITVNGGTLSVTGDGVVDAPVSGSNTTLRADGDVFFLDDFSNTGVLIKSGAGTTYLCGGGDVTIANANRDPTGVANNTGALTELPSNGDIPPTSLAGSLNIVSGKLVTGLNPAQYVRVGTHFYFGPSFFELDGNGDILPAELEIYGGTFYCNNDMYIARNAGMYEYRYPALRGKRRNLTFTMWDGTFSCGGLYTQHSNIGSGYYKGNVTFNIHGGTFTSRGSYVQMGYAFNAANTNIINIYGGAMRFTTTTWSVSGRPVNGNFELNLYGGEFSTKLPFFSAGNGSAHSVTYNLAGGTLAVPLIYRYASGNNENIFWNGGIYKPSSNNCAIVGTHKTWTKNECRAGGAKFDLSGITAASPTFTCDQAFTHQSGLAGADGGVEMLGGGTLVLAVANTMDGPVTASGGTVKGMVAGSVPALVLNGGSLDGNGLDHAITYLKGAGGVAANGSLSVADSMAPLSGAAADAPYAVVDNLAFGSACLVACPVAVEDGEQTAPYFRVTGSVSGTARLDFARDGENPLPTNLRVKVAECAAGVAPPTVRGVNTGLEKKYFVSSETVVNAQTGLTDVYAILKPVGTMMIFK